MICIVCEVLNFMIEIVKSQCVKNHIQIEALKDSEIYGKIAACIDEVVYDVFEFFL